MHDYVLLRHIVLIHLTHQPPIVTLAAIPEKIKILCDRYRLKLLSKKSNPSDKKQQNYFNSY